MDFIVITRDLVSRLFELLDATEYTEGAELRKPVITSFTSFNVKVGIAFLRAYKPKDDPRANVKSISTYDDSFWWN